MLSVLCGVFAADTNDKFGAQWNVAERKLGHVYAIATSLSRITTQEPRSKNVALAYQKCFDRIESGDLVKVVDNYSRGISSAYIKSLIEVVVLVFIRFINHLLTKHLKR